jgi:excisionase family DNA binding protein
MKETANEGTFYKVWDLERELSVSRATIYRWCKRGVIEYVKLPSGHIRIPREEIEKLKQRTK